MVWIEIDDEIWKVYKKSWALMGVRTKKKLVKMLEIHVFEDSTNVLRFAETELIDDTPEARAQRKIGLAKERRNSENQGKMTDERAE